MMPLRIGAAVLGLVLLGAGCTDGAGSASTTGGSAPATVATTTTGPTTTAPTTTGPATTEPAPSDPRGATLDERRAEWGAPGVLALVVDGGRRWFGSSGTADLEGAPITEVTRFRIASITKPIVAALVLQAVDRGEVSLDDVVGDILPGVLRPDPPVTVRMLLDHTSGIFDESNEGDPESDIPRLPDAEMRREAESLLARYLAGEQVIAPDSLLVALSETHDRYFAPGEGFHYSNTNYQVAAMVLEQVTGSPLADLLEERVIAPLGLEHTSIAPPDRSSPEMRGYGTSVDDGSLVDVTDDLIAFGNGGNGGIMTTADELFRMMAAIMSGELFPAELVGVMERTTVESGGTYGLGLGPTVLSCGTFYGHQGGVNGTASIALVSPSGDRGMVAALNLRDGGDPGLAAFADELLCRVP